MQPLNTGMEQEGDQGDEMFTALKATGIACETLRKYISMLKVVARECRNTVVDEMFGKGKIIVGKDNKEPFSLKKRVM
ncbi:MAG TPA: hypothetical protein VGB78_01395 [Thermoplasmata archaeon]